MGATTTRLRLDDGTEEEVGFFGGLFGVTHIPSGPARGRALICSPVYSEFLKNNSREVQLGRRLASMGIAAQRFHYRGTGNSSGGEAELTLESMREDASTAMERLVEVAGDGVVDLVSTRLSSLACSPLMSSGSQAVMWEPVNDGKRFFRDLTRAVLILGVKHGGSRTPQDLEEEFVSTGALDIAGFSVARSLRDSASAVKLDIPSGSGGVLVLQLGRSTEIRKDIGNVAATVESAGRPVTCVPLEFEEAWWFHQDVNLLRPEEGATLDAVLVEHSVAFLSGEPT
jgi:hypothetical protein